MPASSAYWRGTFDIDHFRHTCTCTRTTSSSSQATITMLCSNVTHSSSKCVCKGSTLQLCTFGTHTCWVSDMLAIHLLPHATRWFICCHCYCCNRNALQLYTPGTHTWQGTWKCSLQDLCSCTHHTGSLADSAAIAKEKMLCSYIHLAHTLFRVLCILARHLLPHTTYCCTCCHAGKLLQAQHAGLLTSDDGGMAQTRVNVLPELPLLEARLDAPSQRMPDQQVRGCCCLNEGCAVTFWTGDYLASTALSNSGKGFAVVMTAILY